MQTEEQKIQELLKPRYLLTADFPGCSFEVGTILEPNEEGELYSKKAGYSWTVSRVLEKDVKKFKHLFRKLEWHEEREESEMPEYVRPKEQTETSKLQFGNYILKVAQKHKNYFRAENLFQLSHQSWHHYIPATAADYNSYISSTDKKEKV